MHYTITKSDDPFHFRVTPYGDASAVRFQWMFTEIASIVAGFDCPPVLLDERQSSFDKVDEHDLLMARDFLIRKNHVLGHSKLAILTNSGRDLEVVRRFRHIAASGALAKIRVFDDEAEAVSWLRGSSGGWLACFLALVLYAVVFQICRRIFAVWSRAWGGRRSVRSRAVSLNGGTAARVRREDRQSKGWRSFPSGLVQDSVSICFRIP